MRHVSGDDGMGASILVVEDDEQIAELMRDFLEAAGFQVRHAGSGRETTELVDVIRAAAVLEDRDVSYAHIPAVKYALCTMGSSEEGAFEKKLLDKILFEALPQSKHMSAVVKMYDSLGSVAEQMSMAHSEALPNPEQRFMISCDYLKSCIFV